MRDIITVGRCQTTILSWKGYWRQCMKRAVAHERDHDGHLIRRCGDHLRPIPTDAPLREEVCYAESKIQPRL